MLPNLRTDLALPCTLRWGTDPCIELSGTAVEISAETLIVDLEHSDRRLWPEPGRRIQVFVEWSTAAAADRAQKYFACRGTVQAAVLRETGGIRLSCRIRHARFTDAQSKRNSRRRTAAANGWMM